jgi:hypothetical protein
MATAFSSHLQRASKKMLYLRDQYLKAFPNEEATLDPAKISRWACQQGIWKPIETRPDEVLRRKISRALRHEYITDPQGRDVRASFASVEEVMTPDGPKRMARFYKNFQAPVAVAEQHFKLERRIAVENAAQLSLDLQSYNDNNTVGAILKPLDWNISRDIDERNMPTKYGDDPYGDGDDDED